MTINSAVTLRRAGPADADAVADVWLRSFAAALPGVRRAHTDDEVRDWFRHVVLPASAAGGTGSGTWVAVADGAVVGMMVLDEARLEQLYLDPDWRGRALGDAFLDLARRQCPTGLELWTFQVNAPARRFYARHGFRAVEHTDGRGNEENEPDVRYVWRPRDGDGTDGRGAETT